MKILGNIPLILILLLSGLALNAQTACSQSIMEKIKNHKRADRFARALEKADLDKRLSRPGPYTVFVPTNEAFTKLSPKLKGNSSLLLNHIFIGMATERSLQVMSSVTCLSGRTIRIKDNGQKKITVNSLPIMDANIRAENGVIHIIKGVIK